MPPPSLPFPSLPAFRLLPPTLSPATPPPPLQHLEKDPLVEVPCEPSALLDKTRYRKSSRMLSDADEAVLEATMARLSDKCYKRGQPVKAFFDDAATDVHSAK